MSALIYLVEDSPATREQLRRGLQPLGAELELFERAEDCLAAVAERCPDLVVTDVVLPGISGVELCAKLRESHERIRLPVIVVSSREGLDDVAKAYEAGADDYLPKPVNLHELRDRVTLFLRRKSNAEGPPWERYTITGELGRNAQAVTLRARRKDDDTPCVLKALTPAAPQEAIDRLLAEAELLRSLGEVMGVVGVRDVGSDGGRTYYAMDLIEGETLAERLARGPLPAPEAARVCRQIAGTLSHLAAKGVIHGDLKPSNVVLGPSGPILIDFGLAGRQGGERGGTLAYVAPEVMRGAHTSERSDLYALGVMLYEALCGRRPYAETGERLTALKLEGRPPDLSYLVRELHLSPGLIALIEEALEPDPERRTVNATGFAVGLLPYSVA